MTNQTTLLSTIIGIMGFIFVFSFFSIMLGGLIGVILHIIIPMGLVILLANYFFKPNHNPSH